MAKGKISSNAQFSGTGNFFTILGDHISGLNGGVNTSGSNNETTMFQATTGKYYSVCNIRYSISSSSGDDIEMKMYYNGITVFGEYATSGTTEGEMFPLNIIIPPLTEVKLTANNKASSTGREVFTIITGRIYD